MSIRSAVRKIRDVAFQQGGISVGKELLWTTLIGFCKCTAMYYAIKPQVRQLRGFSFHSCLYFTQRIKMFENNKEHNDKAF